MLVGVRVRSSCFIRLARQCIQNAVPACHKSIIYAPVTKSSPHSPQYIPSHHFAGRNTKWNFCTMAPTLDPLLQKKIDDMIKEHKVMIFSKSTCPFCRRVKALFTSLNVPFYAWEVDLEENTSQIQDVLQAKSGQRTVPNVFINGGHVGGSDTTVKLNEEGLLLPMVFKEEPHEYEYDLVVIGGGSGGLAASKEAANLGKKVAVCDFIVPTPIGTTWGLGGTCVNVGCIPKKLMHQSALLGQAINDSRAFGWKVNEGVEHDWGAMVQGVQEHIRSLNWGYRVALRDKKVNYLNAYATFVDTNTLSVVDKKKKEQKITAKQFIIASGGRPRYPDIPGAKEYGLTSDDLFSLTHNPGKTLFVGASYIALECAGFLAGLGIDSTVMVRSILLRGFDQQIANFIGDHMEKHGVKFIRECIPTKVEQIKEGEPGLLKVTGKKSNGEQFEEQYNTVVFAVGRDPCTKGIGLEKLGVNLNSSGKIVIDDHERTNIPNIYAIGDVTDGKWELTPVAVQAGKLLARRLFRGSTLLTDYNKVPTTVFTPLEYGCVGMSEEEAIEVYGAADIDVFHNFFMPLEWVVPKRDENTSYAKLVCVKSKQNLVVGFHVLGPNAGEMTQGFALGLKMGAKKDDFDGLIGIHPTCAEIFTTLDVTKSSGKNAQQKGC